MNVKGSFGNWLRQRRKALDLTQLELADQIGCSVVTIRKIEADERRPSKQITERLMDVLALAPEQRSSFMAFARRTEAIPSSQPLQRVMAAVTHNLPPQPTPLVGRANELRQIGERLDDPACRLLTLVGAGGIGKTRLALQAATEKADDFEDGVYFIPLTSVGSPNLVASAIAHTLEISFYGSEDPVIQIIRYLREKHMLLVLDNFEHLLEASSLLSEILAAAPAVKILATSRERLNVQEEWTFVIEGLPFPKDSTTDPPESFSAVQLFLQRAQQVQAKFSLSQNVEAVLSICRYVEGLPLGLELAASWLRVMSCQQIMAQIERSLDFLSTPLRNVPERHRSLRAVFEQSWKLLSEAERTILAKLSVFRGGFDLESAEYVTGASITTLASLADKSLIRPNAAHRYDLHELLRQFAAEKLAEFDDPAEINRRHLTFFSTLADNAEAHLYGPQKEAWFDRLEVNLDNLRAALEWTLRNKEAEAGLRLASALGFFWEHRAYFHEGHEWLKNLLMIDSNIPASVRAKALRVAVALVNSLGDYDLAMAYCEESLRLAREARDKLNIAWALSNLGFHVWLFDDLSRLRLEEALALFREIGDEFGISHSLRRLAAVLINEGKYAEARTLTEEALTLAREANDKNATAWSLAILAKGIWAEYHDSNEMLPLLEESLPLAEEVRDRFLVAYVLFFLGLVAQSQGGYEQAQTRYIESLATFRELGVDKQLSANALIGFAELARVQRRPERAVRLLAAASTFRNSSFDLLPPNRGLQHDVPVLRAQLGEAAFATAWAEGKAMTADQAISYALEKPNNIVY